MIKPWIFEFFGAPAEFHERFDAAASQRYFDAYLDLWASAEPAGFEGIFFSEHHFGLSYSPSPNLLIAAIAHSTVRLRLGTMGVVLPLYQPWRVLEEIGMLDHLTGGDHRPGHQCNLDPTLRDQYSVHRRWQYRLRRLHRRHGGALLNATDPQLDL